MLEADKILNLWLSSYNPKYIRISNKYNLAYVGNGLELKFIRFAAMKMFLLSSLFKKMPLFP
jgi:hypothetical protein